MLAVLPVMSAAAEEPAEITSIEDADNIMAAYDDEDTEWEEIYLDSAEDMEKFSYNCRLDTWSVNKKVYLTKDIDLSDSTTRSILLQIDIFQRFSFILIGYIHIRFIDASGDIPRVGEIFL